MIPSNPWLQIPPTDYEKHMSSPQVAQTEMLSELFGKALQNYHPEKIAYLGCTTGNGFEKIDWSKTQMLVGYDINPDFLLLAEENFKQHKNKFKLICSDLDQDSLENHQFDLVFAALLFEYLRPSILIKKISAILKPGAVLSVVLQLANPSKPAISKTQYKSLEKLSPLLKLVDPKQFKKWATEEGLLLISEEEITSASGKKFLFADFKKKNQ
jgi:ubiquinone/menaquinone biosynthesis C-methylase UbiE